MSTNASEISAKPEVKTSEYGNKGAKYTSVKPKRCHTEVEKLEKERKERKKQKKPEETRKQAGLGAGEYSSEEDTNQRNRKTTS